MATKTYIIKDQGKGEVSSVPVENIVEFSKGTSSDGVTGDYIPLTGTKEGKPVVGNIVLKDYINIKNNINNRTYGSIYFEEHKAVITSNSNIDFPLQRNISLELDCVDEEAVIIKSFSGIKGIVGDREFDKQGDRKAFAQLSDVYDSQSYSTEETKTGGTWIDGKPIYRKVITENINIASKSTSISSLNIDTLIEFKSLAKNIDNDDYIYTGETIIHDFNDMTGELDEAFQVGAIYYPPDEEIIYSNKINMYDGSGWKYSESGTFRIICILEYTKTTDV